MILKMYSGEEAIMSVRVGKVCVNVCNCGSGITFMKTEVCIAEWFYGRNYFPSSTLIFFMQDASNNHE